MTNIKIGDLVRYRRWEPVDELKSRRDWGDYGIVVAIEDWRQGVLLEGNCGITFLNQRSEFIRARAAELESVEYAAKPTDYSETAL